MTDPDAFSTVPPPTGAAPARRLKDRLQALASALLLPALQRVAGDRVGGSTLEAAWRVVERVRGERLGYTLGYWDGPGDTPATVMTAYRRALERLVGAAGYLSIKPPALRFHGEAADELARAAAEAGVRLHCDSHALSAADATLAFAERLAERLPPHQVSISLPARWGRSSVDVARLGRRAIGVRVVKGQWPDPAAPSACPREGFLALTERLADDDGGGWVALATHDAALLQQAIPRLAGRGFELEKIHGLERAELFALAADAGAPARLYVPFGEGFAVSALGVLRRNPRLLVAMLRSRLGV
ncbi:MAG: hypothetical protein ABW042_08305 [Phenylobacterium sp.]